MSLLTRPLFLASASPRRADLLAQIGLAFRVSPSHIDEPPPLPGENVLVWAKQAAVAKAQAAAQQLGAITALILAADTVVITTTPDAQSAPRLHGEPVRVLGKPSGPDEARQILMSLSGRSHTVLSAFAIMSLPEGTIVADAVETRVFFRTLSTMEIEAYIETGEPFDKAGAYGIQGMGAILIERIEGDYFTVVGLPLARLWERLAPWRIKLGDGDTGVAIA